MSQWAEWLRALRAARRGPVGESDGWPSATRGLAWSAPVAIAGDWTGASLEGTISSSPDAESPLATFSVSGPVVADGWSTWTLSLAAGTGADSTGALPADVDQDGVVRLPFMVRITPDGGDQQLLFGGLFTVVGAV